MSKGRSSIGGSHVLQVVALAHCERHSSGMAPTFVLPHSLALGPGTWRPVSKRLNAAGHASVVPGLQGVTNADPPFWPYVVDTVNAAMNRLENGRQVLVVAHSNVGQFVPVLIEHASRPVRDQASGTFEERQLNR